MNENENINIIINNNNNFFKKANINFRSKQVRKEVGVCNRPLSLKSKSMAKHNATRLLLHSEIQELFVHYRCIRSLLHATVVSIQNVFQ